MRHVCRDHRLEACIYTTLFFLSFPLHNHSLRLQALLLPKIYLPSIQLSYTSENLWQKYLQVRLKYNGGCALLVRYACVVPDHCQNLSTRGGKSGQNIPRVIGGIAKRGGSCQRDHYVGLCVQSTHENKPSQVVCPTPTKLFPNASASENGWRKALCPASPILSKEKPHLRAPQPPSWSSALVVIMVNA